MSLTLQEYNYHLGAVNTVTFVDEGRRFVSTSDDKTIRVWEFGIPVQIKYIADPSLHSIPAVAVHPNKQWFIGTSLDNQIVTYAARDRFRQNRKKVFKVRGLQRLPSLTLLAAGPSRRTLLWQHSLVHSCWPQGWLPAPDGRTSQSAVILTLECQHAQHMMPQVFSVMYARDRHAWLAFQALTKRRFGWLAPDAIAGAIPYFIVGNVLKCMHAGPQGHTVAGYACQPAFSPDGRYVLSGDGEGKLWFWDWKTCKAYRTIKVGASRCPSLSTAYLLHGPTCCWLYCICCRQQQPPLSRLCSAIDGGLLLQN